MSRTARQVRVLHVNDCAFTAENLLKVAHERGLPWELLPLAASGQTWVGSLARARRAALGAIWLARLAERSWRADLLHVHFATVVHHTRVIPRRYVLHAHGTDVRTLQYDDRYGPIIRRAMSGAAALVYSTPDLAEHTLPSRPDAIYLPVPIDVDGAPTWSPETRPRVFFASRWDNAKGLPSQLAMAQQLLRAVGPDVTVTGLDWGPAADAAREVGVHLLPRRDHAGYLSLLATSQVVVGQSSGILAASDLEALAIGVPVVMTASHSLYAEDPPPVLDLAAATTDDAVDQVMAALADPAAFASRQQGRAWVAAHHSAPAQVDRLLELYSSLV